MPSHQPPRYTRQLEAFRKLSEGIAHDINNLLSSILGYSDLLLIDPAIDHLKIQVKEISNAGKRIASLSSLLAAFGDKYRHQPEILDLNEVILAIEGFLPRILGKEISFIATKNPELWPVKADPAKMKQALITLAVDMKSAMPEGGTLRLSAKNLTTPPAPMPGRQLEPRSYVLVTATSSGNIAADEVSESLLDLSSLPPNAPIDKETSGLPSVAELVKMASGSLVIESCSERELRVSMCLPAIHFQPGGSQTER
jgi:two-component system cell cycle sensor histidine kinase/response regulator CckA